MVIEWLRRAADMLLTRGVRRRFVSHGGYLLPPLSTTLIRLAAFWLTR